MLYRCGKYEQITPSHLFKSVNRTNIILTLDTAYQTKEKSCKFDTGTATARCTNQTYLLSSAKTYSILFAVLSLPLFRQGRSTMYKLRVMMIKGPVHMIPGQLIAPGQLTDPGVNFASVHGLTLLTVHMSFSLPRGNFERRVTRCPTPGNPPCRGNFSPCEQNAKVAPGQEQSCACSFLMFGINFPTKSSRKHQK